MAATPASRRPAGRPAAEHWAFFKKVPNLVYSPGCPFATCNACMPGGAPSSLVAELKSFPVEEQKRRALEEKMIPATTRALAQHLIECTETPETAKRIGHASMHRVKNARREIEARSKLNGPSPPTPACSRKSSSSTQSCISDFANHIKYDRSRYTDLICEFVAVHNISFRAACSEEFKSLLAFLVGSEGSFKRQRLAISRQHLVTRLLPGRAKKARESQADDIMKGPIISRGYTLSDDGWLSRNKDHFCGVSIGRPGCEAQVVALKPINSEELDGCSIARGWEMEILAWQADVDHLSKEQIRETLSAYFIKLSRIPDAICCDSAGASSRARRIAAVRHPKIIFVPCQAHIAALICGDLLTRGQSSYVVGDSLYVVNFFYQLDVQMVAEATGLHESRELGW
jgi:hypothetical protein